MDELKSSKTERIVLRLRDYGQDREARVCVEAADLIERQAGEIAWLREQIIGECDACSEVLERIESALAPAEGARDE